MATDFGKLKAMKKQLIFVSGFLGAVLFVMASILGGLQIEGYSFVSQYISESFASGLPNTDYLRMMYAVSGLLIFTFGILVPSVLPSSGSLRTGFWLFALFYGLGTLTVAIFPCDFGCPTDPEISSLAQIIHNASALFTYIVAPSAIIGIGRSLKKWTGLTSLSRVSLTCGSLALLFVVVLLANPQGAFIGLLQRMIEANLLGWVVYTSFDVRNPSNPSL